MLNDISPMADATASQYSSPRSGHRFPAVVGQQGARFSTFVTQIAPHDIEALLGHDPRSRNHHLLRDHRIKTLYDHVQRKTEGGRLHEIDAYIRERIFLGQPIAGALPAVSLATEQPIFFSPFQNQLGVGEMVLETGRQNRRIVLDGLGRITGFLDLVDLVTGEHAEDEAVKELDKLLREYSMATIFFSPKLGQPPMAVEEMEQLFADFNFRGRRVSPKDAIALDHSDPYIETTRWLSKTATAIAGHGGMQEKAASLGKKSKEIVVQPVLLRFVRAAIEGQASVEGGRNVAIKNPNLTASRAPEIRADLADFLNTLAAAMGPAWSDRSSMHLSSPGWQTIGVLYHDMAFRLGKGPGDLKKFAGAVARLDWRRDGELFRPFMTEKVGDDGSVALMLNSAGASVRRALVKACREKLGLDDIFGEDEGESIACDTLSHSQP